MSSTVKFQNGIQGASQGAQMGSLFGPWGAVIGGVIGGVLGLTTPDYEGKAIKKHNDEVVKNAMHDLFDLRRVQNAQNMQTAQTLMQYQDQRKLMASQANVQYGAVDMLGASTEALKKTMDFQTNEAMSQTMYNWEVGVGEHNQEVHRITNSAQNSLRRQRGAQNQIDYSGLIKTGMSAYKGIKGSGNSGSTSVTGVIGDNGQVSYNFGSSGGSSSGGGLGGFFSNFGSFFGGGK